MTNTPSNVPAEKKDFGTGLTKLNNLYMPLITDNLQGNGLELDNYSKQCVMASISGINAVLDSKGLTWKEVDQSNVTQTLITIASLKLNAAANPREVYFTIRNEKKKVNGKDVWSKKIEMGIEGDGNDAILSNFGRNVDTVHQHWLVRENDGFTYPTFRGIELEPPTWTPKGTGKVVRVVYPVTKTNGETDYHISEREDVSRNLFAHISNNMMNETFGIAKSRYDATTPQKAEIDKKKGEFLAQVKSYLDEHGLDATLDNSDFDKYISPAWKDPQSRESMIIRKMRNNIVKKIPKDFSNAFVEMTYEENSDSEYSRVRKEVYEEANQELIDLDEDNVPEAAEEDIEVVEAEIIEDKKPQMKADF